MKSILLIGLGRFGTHLAEELSRSGHSIAQIDVRKKHNISIVAIRTEGKVIGPVSPDIVLTDEMTLLVMGDYKSVKKCFHL